MEAWVCDSTLNRTIPVLIGRAMQNSHNVWSPVYVRDANMSANGSMMFCVLIYVGNSNAIDIYIHVIIEGVHLVLVQVELVLIIQCHW